MRNHYLSIALSLLYLFSISLSLYISIFLSLYLYISLCDYLSISLSRYLSISLSLYEAPRRLPRVQEAPKGLPGLPRRLPEGSQEAPRRLPGGSQGNQGSRRPLREGRAIVCAFLLRFMQKWRSFVTFTKGS